jgi:S1-C subfamily serine protease
VPVDLAREVMEAIVRHGRVIRGWIGVEPRDLSPDLAASLGLGQARGVLITGVLQNGPAAQAGLRPGDVVTQVGARRVDNTADLLRAVASLSPRSRAPIVVQRNGQAQTLQVTVGQRPLPDELRR